MTVVVVGAGSAGLSVSSELRLLGVEHVVLERHRVGQAWRDRWDSFTLVTPNWTLDLPGSPYAGRDPEGHVPRDEIVSYLEDYGANHAGTIREGISVHSLDAGRSKRFRLDTSEGPIETDTVVICSGAYQRPHRPAIAAGFPSDVAVLDSTQYRNPSALPDGKVLIVGSGQTGVQLAEELHLSGRNVVLSCGRAPWLPRRLGDKDIVTWLNRTTFFDQPLPAQGARLVANLQTTGARGGHDLHYRVLRDLGVQLVGRLAAVSNGRIQFANDLADSVAFGDARYLDIRRLLRDTLGDAVPEMSEPLPFEAKAASEVDLDGFGAVVFTSGFRPDYGGWVKFPVFDERGFPIADDALATAVAGLYFCGVHFLRKRRSSLLFGVGEDAAIIACTITKALTASPTSA